MENLSLFQDEKQAKKQELEKKQTNENTFRFSYINLLTDYASRWILMEALIYHLIPEWLFWTAQLLLFIPVLIFVFWRQENITEKYKITSATFIESSGWTIFLFLVVIVSGAYLTFTLLSDLGWAGQSLLTILITGLYTLYLVMIYEFSPQNINEAQRLINKEQKLKELEIPFEENQDEVDANDIRITRMETEIASISHRVDSYTLESALFGALAFSSFLTLIAADKPVLENIQGFVSKFTEILYELGQFDFKALGDLLNLISTSDYLMGAIAIQTLICSMFFVALIVSRLRFYTILKNVDYGIRIARMYNDKEEGIHSLLLEIGEKPQLKDRMQKLGQNLAQALDEVNPLFRDLLIVTGFMWVLRNLGITSFVLILLTSAFLVSKELAIIFAILFISALLYTAFDSWFRNKKLKNSKFFRAWKKRIFHVKPKGKA